MDGKPERLFCLDALRGLDMIFLSWFTALAAQAGTGRRWTASFLNDGASVADLVYYQAFWQECRIRVQ